MYGSTAWLSHSAAPRLTSIMTRRFSGVALTASSRRKPPIVFTSTSGGPAPRRSGALRSNQIGGAALDVTDPEPLPVGHPMWELPNCLITPYTADTEQMTEPLLAARIAENVRRLAARHELEGRVDPDLGY